MIIPTWNRSETVERAILSALNQTYPVFEVLVCDDGSTDNTAEIVRAIGDPRVKWIEGDHAGRPAVPRNRGIKASTGDLIAFLDSDDSWFPEKLEVQVRALLERDFDAVCCNAYRDIGQENLGRLISWETSDITFSDLLFDNRVVCSSVVVRRELLNKTGLFPESGGLRVGEDYSLWLRLTQFTKVIYLAEPFVLYKDDPKNSIRAQGPSAIKQKTRAFLNYFCWHIKVDSLAALVNVLRFLIVVCIFYGAVIVRKCLSIVFAVRQNCILIKNKKKIKYIWGSHAAVEVEFQSEAKRTQDGPLVSVLLPTYNSSSYLRQSVESILRQTYKNFELIVVDDASEDGTAAVLDDFDDSRIVRITFDKNQGIVNALNTALRRAKGSYVARMDADDIAKPDRLLCQVDFLEKHPDVVIVGTWIQGFGRLRRPYIHRYPVANGEIQSSQYFENPFAHPSVMIRLSVFDKLGKPYCPAFPYVEDWELWGRVFEFGKAANIPEELLFYRVHPSSSNHRFSDVQKSAKKRLLLRKYLSDNLTFRPEFILEKPISDVAWLRGCYEYFNELAHQAATNPRINREDFTNVLQKQLCLRVRQMKWLGVYPAWFTYKYGFSRKSYYDRLLSSLKILIITNMRALLQIKIWGE